MTESAIMENEGDVKTVSTSFMERVIALLARILVIIAGVMIFLMIILTVGEVCLRYLGFPILGNYEVMAMLMVVVSSFALGHTLINDSHVSVIVVTQLFSPRIQALIQGIVTFFGIALFGCLVWKSIDYAISSIKVGEVTMTLHLSLAWLILPIGLGCLVMFLALFLTLTKSIRKVLQK
ncbi:MAG: TRAP transporter small permease [Pseudomonadota bacterium]